MLIFIIIIVAALHLWFMILEMFLWTKPIGLKIFRNTPDEAGTMRILAGNQGLYNGFLAAGLFYSFVINCPDAVFHLRIFCLTCISFAGLYGAITVSRKIFFIQALPALIGLMTLVVGHGDFRR